MVMRTNRHCPETTPSITSARVRNRRASSSPHGRVCRHSGIVSPRRTRTLTVMEVRFIKRSDARHDIAVIRDDGSTERAELDSRSFLNHDFAHLAVEAELGLNTDSGDRWRRVQGQASTSAFDDCVASGGRPIPRRNSGLLAAHPCRSDDARGVRVARQDNAIRRVRYRRVDSATNDVRGASSALSRVVRKAEVRQPLHLAGVRLVALSGTVGLDERVLAGG